MPQRLVIYMPPMVDYATQAKLRNAYPTAQFTGHWEDGAMMWQVALEKLGSAA